MVSWYNVLRINQFQQPTIIAYQVNLVATNPRSPQHMNMMDKDINRIAAVTMLE
jgi:hypothetical protein